ncbi:MAG: PIG-L family deacetylase [Vicinamibacteria bacterium]|nr:PIG-L family deacetylase [Vicinamibacteria bacterium]
MSHRVRPAFAALVTLVALLAVPRSEAQLAPIPQDQGAAGLGLALRRLPVSFNVLYVTAHPDDENNGVLTLLSRGMGVRTGLLTVTRGDGGQNEIGPELFQAIGILRTEELAGVHRYDAAEQYFTKAYEFGYSFSVEETLQKWGKEEILDDVVRVFRTFRPDVVLTLSLEAPGGGQHHQTTARLAKEAFRVAADPNRFPDQVKEGLLPWQALRDYQGGVGGGLEKLEGEMTTVATNGFDPLLGMSYAEFGSIGRSFHKCQGGGQLKSDPGDGRATYYIVDSEPKIAGGGTSILPDDISVKALARFAKGEEDKASFLSSGLAGIQDAAAEALAAYDPKSLGKVVPALRKGMGATRSLIAQVKGSGLSPLAKANLLHRLERKVTEFEQALILAHGVVFQAVANDDNVVRGQAFDVRALVVNQGDEPVKIEEVSLMVPSGWSVSGKLDRTGDLAPGQKAQGTFTVTTGAAARYTQPYWKRNYKVDRYDIEIPRDHTLPWSPSDVQARFSFSSAGTTFGRTQAAQYRYEGRWVGGEKQKEVNVVPVLSVHLTPEIVVAPKSTVAVKRELRVAVKNGGKGAVDAVVKIDAGKLKVEPASAPVKFRYEGEELTVRFFVTVPPGTPESEFTLKASAEANGETFTQGYQVIAYDHTQERHLFHDAASVLRVQDVKVAPGVRVGYIMGAGDEVADAIAQLGVTPTMLSADDLAYGDLSRYTTIVTGTRAFQTRDDLKANYARVMKYVEDGGNLVVQYNKFEFNVLSQPAFAGGFSGGPGGGPGGGGARPVQDSPFAPYAASVTSNRVTVEEAPIEIVAPASRLVNAPNKITSRDFDGWVQERGLYFFGARDPKYVDVLKSADPWPKNPGEKKGLLVETTVGKGTWSYVGLGLFRQLPSGTPGAYRILANLISRPRGVVAATRPAGAN